MPGIRSSLGVRSRAVRNLGTHSPAARSQDSRSGGISVRWVAVIGARWWWRRSRNSSDYSGCPSDRCSESGSWPATRRCANGSTRSRSQYPSAEAAFDGIVGVCAGGEAQG